MIPEKSLPTTTIPAGQGVWTSYGSATIKAPAKEVYAAIRDLASYPTWNLYTTHIVTATNTNFMKVGDTVTVHFRPEPHGSVQEVKCEVIELDDEAMAVTWRGMPGGIPRWILNPEKTQRVTVKGEGECLYEIWETQTGPLAWVIYWMMGSKLSEMNPAIARALKEYVEEKQGGM